LKNEPIYDIRLQGDRLVCLTPCPVCGARLVVRALPDYLAVECSRLVPEHGTGYVFHRVLSRYGVMLTPYT
jgi:hypothetical protein